MRAILVFPPLAGPTYVPLGIASLAAHLSEVAPRLELTLRDSNVSWWHRLARADPEGPGVVAFCQGREGRFLDQAAYESHVPGLGRLWGRMHRQRVLVEQWLAQGVQTPEVEDHLQVEVEAILAADPEWIGLSVLYPEQLPFAVALGRAVRDADRRGGMPGEHNAHWKPGKRRIVLGGAALSALSQEALLEACPFIDGLVVGEGEAAVAALAAGAPPESVPGLVYQTERGIRRAATAAAEPATPWPRPDFSGLDLAAYWNPEPVLPLVGSRACPWRRCRFCAHNLSFGRHRAKEARALVEELGALGRLHGARHVYLADQAVEPVGLDALAAALEEAGVAVSLHAMMRPTPDIGAEAMARWARAGLRWVSWGVESGSQRLIDLVRKGVRADRLGPLFEAASGAGVANLPMLIFGLPTSTDEDAEATYALLAELWPHLAAMTASAFVLFEGTHFGRHPDRYGLEVERSEPALVVDGGVVPSTRLGFRERAADGALRPPRGPLEVAAWRQRARWLPELPVTDRMPVEHLLLYAAARQSATRVPPVPEPSTPPTPSTPSSPISPATPPAPIVPAPLAA